MLNCARVPLKEHAKLFPPCSGAVFIVRRRPGDRLLQILCSRRNIFYKGNAKKEASFEVFIGGKEKPEDQGNPLVMALREFEEETKIPGRFAVDWIQCHYNKPITDVPLPEDMRQYFFLVDGFAITDDILEKAQKDIYQAILKDTSNVEVDHLEWIPLTMFSDACDGKTSSVIPLFRKFNLIIGKEILEAFSFKMLQ